MINHICICVCTYIYCIALHCDSIGAHMSGNISSCQNGTQTKEKIVHLKNETEGSALGRVWDWTLTRSKMGTSMACHGRCGKHAGAQMVNQ